MSSSPTTPLYCDACRSVIVLPVSLSTTPAGFTNPFLNQQHSSHHRYLVSPPVVSISLNLCADCYANVHVLRKTLEVQYFLECMQNVCPALFTEQTKRDICSSVFCCHAPPPPLPSQCTTTASSSSSEGGETLNVFSDTPPRGGDNLATVTAATNYPLPHPFDMSFMNEEEEEEVSSSRGSSSSSTSSSSSSSNGGNGNVCDFVLTTQDLFEHIRDMDSSLGFQISMDD